VSKRAQKNAGLVWSEDRRRATDANRGGGDHGFAIPEKRGRKTRLVNRKFSSSSRFFLPAEHSSSCRFLAWAAFFWEVIGVDRHVPPRKVYKGDRGQV
jgi:hypothetical protein